MSIPNISPQPRRKIGSKPANAKLARRAIEAPAFPFEAFSAIAEVESWRKEIHRPIYHVHKWWAQRLGSVFRAILLGAMTPAGSDTLDLFYRRHHFGDTVVFDPFMGSGTTLGEAAKLGARAVGRDINPVAHFAVTNALRSHDRVRVVEIFENIRQEVSARLMDLYKTELADGTVADVLYYFWVKTVPCPACSVNVDLFSSYIFARHAYPAKFPQAQAVCADCGAVNEVRHDAQRARCTACGNDFNPQSGPARGTKAECSACRVVFPILQAVRTTSEPPAHRLYAKLVLLPDGSKRYFAANEKDSLAYGRARKELAERPSPYPVVPIEAGHNTTQAINYNYRYWHQLFNERQLLCLSILGECIARIEDEALRDLFICLFSGCLEFNNMFASYKGEGTGAVRHMFSHHILKPERTPLEANIWGTPKSSGSFSTLFESRLLRALDYQANPTEIRVRRNDAGRLTGDKVSGISDPLGCSVGGSYREFQQGANVYVSCGDSSKTDMPDLSVDLVVTDPPFFDNVNYSELADFFFVWQCHLLGQREYGSTSTTRSPGEVQQKDPDEFASRLAGVWIESARVLRDDGLLIFTYHHSRPEGWDSLLRAIMIGGFVVVQTFPIKAEMSGAAPKSQASEPIDLDIVVVCRKRALGRTLEDLDDILAVAAKDAGEQISRLNRFGRMLSRNDVRIVVAARALIALSVVPDADKAVSALRALVEPIESVIECLHAGQTLGSDEHEFTQSTNSSSRQVSLF
jgi:adenine-specific DNA methylase